MPEKMTPNASVVLGQVVDALNESLLGFSYDPAAAEEADFAADIIRHLAKTFLRPSTVQADSFWA